MAATDWTDAETAYVAKLKELRTGLPSHEFSVLNFPLSTRAELLRTILFKGKNKGSWVLADYLKFTSPTPQMNFGKRCENYEDDSYRFCDLSTEREFSDALCTRFLEYWTTIATTPLTLEPVESYKSQITKNSFLNHYNKSIRLLLAGPPHRDDHGIDPLLAETWIRAQKSPERQRLARLLIQNTRYISHTDMINNIKLCVDRVYAKLRSGIPTIFLVGLENKSNYYVSLLFYHFWIEKGYAVDDIKSHLDSFSPGNFIDIDEMAYSGSQTHKTWTKMSVRYLNQMVETIVATHGSLKPFQESQNFLPIPLIEQLFTQQNLNLIFLRLYATQEAKKRLLTLDNYYTPLFDDNDTFKFPFHLILGEEFASPKTMFGEENAKKMGVLFGWNTKSPAAAVYFNHKVADIPSTYLHAYSYGVVPDRVLFLNAGTMNKKAGPYVKELSISKNAGRPNSNALQFKPFIKHCQQRPLPKTRKNLTAFAGPNAENLFGNSGKEPPQYYRCPYAWYKNINYNTGTYNPPAALRTVPESANTSCVGAGCTIMGGRRTSRKKFNKRKHRSTRKK